MNRFFYNIFMYALTPFIVCYLGYRALKSDDYKGRFFERFSFNLSNTLNIASSCPVIFIHSVSMGETIAALPLINQLIRDYPNHQILVTTSTPTGSEIVRKNFKDRVQHCYLPLDLIGSVKRFLHHTNPTIAIIMETELWPNLVHQLQQRQTPIFLANARMSEKSMKGYLKKAAPLMHEMLNKLTQVSAQYDSDGDRFIKLGLPSNKLIIGGSIKFDLTINPELIAQHTELKQQWASQRLVWVAGSTHPGENEQILAAHKQLLTHFPDLLLVLIPRHSERFEETTSLAKSEGFEVMNRSDNKPPTKQCQVVIGDSMGEMLLLLGIADVTYIGGSLIERGGHNPLEPAALGKPIVMGPSCYNFSDISQQLIRAGCLSIAKDKTHLVKIISELLENNAQRTIMSNNALKVVEKNQGTLKRFMAVVAKLL